MATQKQRSTKSSAKKRKPSAARTSQSATALRMTGARRRAGQKRLQEDRKKRSEEFFRHLKPVRGTRAFGEATPTLRILAEGDSWFDYPSPGGSIINHLDTLLKKKAAILNLAHAGDELQQMLSLAQRQEIELRLKQGHQRKIPFDALLFSGGGNDIVGDQFVSWLRPFTPGATAPDLIDQPRFGAMLTIIDGGYRDLVEIRDRLSPETKIFVHGYDYPQPTGKGICWLGPWLRPALDARGITNTTLQFEVVKEILVQFRTMLQRIASAHSADFFYVETQGLLEPTKQWWDNEIHPSPKGFDKIAKAFREVLLAQFPQLA